MRTCSRPSSRVLVGSRPSFDVNPARRGLAARFSSQSALDRVLEQQRIDAEAFDAANRQRQDGMPEELREKLMEITRLRGVVDQLIEILNENEFIGEGVRERAAHPPGLRPCPCPRA